MQKGNVFISIDGSPLEEVSYEEYMRRVNKHAEVSVMKKRSAVYTLTIPTKDIK